MGTDMSIISRESFAKFVLIPMCLSQTLIAGKDFWDPGIYRQSATMQRRWTEALLSKVNLDPYQKILDIGCGDGEITAKLSLEKLDRIVIGIDISPKMIAFAKSSFSEPQYKNLSFLEGNAEAIQFENDFDAVVSFNTIHRLPNPQIALQQMYAALKAGGLFAAVFPAIGSKILSESIAKVDTKPEWSKYFEVYDRKEYLNTEEAYSGYLSDIGFIREKVQILWQDEIFETRQAFFDILKASYTQKDSIPAEKQDKFFNEIIDEYLIMMPLDHEGKVHFYFNRMEIIATKPLMAINPITLETM